MKHALDKQALNQLFFNAHSFNRFKEQPVPVRPITFCASSNLSMCSDVLFRVWPKAMSQESRLELNHSQ